MPLTQAQRVAAESLSDEDLVSLARVRDEAAVRAITKRYNRRLFRIARSILRDDSEAEDVVQETMSAPSRASTCSAAMRPSAHGSRASP
jgi:RNA polymerase sigma-70 factor (ECF subfamily)